MGSKQKFFYTMKYCVCDNISVFKTSNGLNEKSSKNGMKRVNNSIKLFSDLYLLS